MTPSREPAGRDNSLTMSEKSERATALDRVDETEAALWAACARADALVSGDGRVSAAVAAELLGMCEGSLRNARSEGSAPPHYRRGVGGGRVSYRLRDLAEWIESARDEE